MSLDFSNVVIKQTVEDWGDDKGFLASDRLWVSLVERFGVSKARVVDATDEGDFLMFRVTSDAWSDVREFAVLSDGSVAWGN